MFRENANIPRRPGEAKRNINQVPDKDIARELAEIEKPIKDLARDPKANKAVREIKPILDKEAERLSGKAEGEARIFKYEKMRDAVADPEYYQGLFRSPISVIELSTNTRTSHFQRVKSKGITTIEDLTKHSYGDIWATQGVGEGVADEVDEWLKDRGLKFEMTDIERKKLTT
jgi:hypothetical protein